MSAVGIIERIREGKWTSVEWVRSSLARIRECEDRLHAWVALDEEGALEEAALLDEKRRQGNPTPPLEGAPLGVKDIFNTERLPTQMGSPLWACFTPGNDARVVATLRRHGCLVLGKTATSEFAVHAPGPTVNPHDPRHTPGTSSSGSAVAVAAGMVPWALGSQTAGSIIRPASYCGVYGFKPSFGLIPRTGMLKTTDTLDHVGFFARTVDDLRLLLDQARVSGPDHPLVMQHLEPWMGRPQPALWRVGLVRGPKWDHAEPYAQSALENFARQLGGCPGIHLQEFSLPALFGQVHDAHQRIYCRSLAYYFKQEAEHPERISASFRSMIEEGRRVSPQEYQEALQFQAQAAAALEEFFRIHEMDILLSLSTGGEAPSGLDSPDRPDSCLLWTFCGVPVLNLPVFAGPQGLPYGAQIVAPRYRDYPLLQFSRFLWERERIPSAPFPPLAAGRPMEIGKEAPLR